MSSLLGVNEHQRHQNVKVQFVGEHQEQMMFICWGLLNHLKVFDSFFSPWQLQATPNCPNSNERKADYGLFEMSTYSSQCSEPIEQLCFYFSGCIQKTMNYTNSMITINVIS